MPPAHLHGPRKGFCGGEAEHDEKESNDRDVIVTTPQPPEFVEDTVRVRVYQYW